MFFSTRKSFTGSDDDGSRTSMSRQPSSPAASCKTCWTPMPVWSGCRPLCPKENSIQAILLNRRLPAACCSSIGSGKTSGRFMPTNFNGLIRSGNSSQGFRMKNPFRRKPLRTKKGKRRDPPWNTGSWKATGKDTCMSQKLGNYNIKTAVVVKSAQNFPERFRELVSELRTGNTFRIFDQLDEAVDWLFA